MRLRKRAQAHWAIPVAANQFTVWRGFGESSPACQVAANSIRVCFCALARLEIAATGKVAQGVERGKGKQRPAVNDRATRTKPYGLQRRGATA